jgi:hypothetical protein
MSLDLAIARQWKLPDDMEAWEFIERSISFEPIVKSATPDLAREIGLEPITIRGDYRQSNGQRALACRRSRNGRLSTQIELMR